ncbi:M2 family metallopeptidase [Arenimonas sp.]|uniref:M2 family metallopeptidase n=1 Tax=Arenimonas sp. TaxID=1872635 RepID=UPI0039E2D6AC
MKFQRVLLCAAVCAALATLAGCKPQGPAGSASSTDKAAAERAAAIANENADQFIERINKEMHDDYREITAAAWLGDTYINEDSQLVSSKANERSLAKLGEYVEQSRRFDGKPMKPETARAIQLLRLGITMPPPKDPKHLAELTSIGTKMSGDYGAGKWCPDKDNPASCKDIGQIDDVLSDVPNRSYDEQLQAWQGWHTISMPMKKDYVRFVELSNEGARDQGFADTGALWRSNYDMKPEEFQAETDRLWGQVKPLYEQLQCYTKNKLVEKYGTQGEVNGMIPAHLTGNLWQQDWSNLWPLVEPYAGVPALDVTPKLKRQRDDKYKQELAGFVSKNGRVPSAAEEVEIGRAADLAQAKAMVRSAEDFYVSLGMPRLPESFWDKAQFVQPRDRDVVCHASAWPMTMDGDDVRIKMCIKPDQDSLETIYHELGHIYYYLAYHKEPALFQNGANDGFHEAIGDTIVLSMTPDYLNSIGLVDKPTVSNEAVINGQMRRALSGVAFLPFGLMIDRWRWGVFDGSIKPDGYNKAWWELKAKYQGVAPATPRGEEFFDPGAKYHVPGNTPYTRYFLARVLQFQFLKSLCDASGYKGPLHQCSFANSPEAGKRYWAMLSKGASQPWQATLKELTGSEQLDGGAILDYFAPLNTWLTEQNKGKQCGWDAAKK